MTWKCQSPTTGKGLPDQAANTKGYVPVLQVGQTLEGYIAPCFDWDMFGFELEEGKYYRLDYLGASSLDGTLRDPNILALFNDGPLSSSYSTEAEPGSGTDTVMESGPSP